MCRFKNVNIKEHTLKKDFNTSYVSVQVSRFNCNKFCSIISIHRMCRFKWVKQQKYQIRIYFNTSYVSVQVFIAVEKKAPHMDFNTSYVSVQDWCDYSFCCSWNISIHRMCRFKSLIFNLLNFIIRISIHRMCRFKIAQL